MDGWAQFGAAMGGAISGAPAQNAFNQGAMQGVQYGGLLEKARSDRAKDLARAAVTPDLVAKAQSGDPAAMATYVSANVQMGANPNDAMLALKTGQGMGYTQQMWQVAQGPNADMQQLYRDRYATASGNPAPLTNVSDGVMTAPSLLPQNQEPVATPVGLANIMLKGAQANQAGAAASKDYAEGAAATNNARANGIVVVDGANGPMLVNKRDPNSAAAIMAGGAPVGYAPSKVAQAAMKGPTSLELRTINAVDDNGTIDPKRTQAFLAWQSRNAATDPRYNNTAFAVQQYATQRPYGADGIGGDPPNANPITTPEAPSFFSSLLSKVLPGAPAAAPASPASPPIASVMSGSAADAGAAPAAPTGIQAAMTGGLPLKGRSFSIAPAAAPSRSRLAAVMSGNAPASPANVGAIPVIGNALAAAMRSGASHTAIAAPASPINGVSRAPSGVYQPTNQQQYDALPAGSVYIRPGETVPRTKGGV